MTAKVLMYSTAVCPYCIRAEQLLKRKGITMIEKIRVDLDPAQRAEMMTRTDAAQCRSFSSARRM